MGQLDSCEIVHLVLSLKLAMHYNNYYLVAKDDSIIQMIETWLILMSAIHPQT